MKKGRVPSAFKYAVLLSILGNFKQISIKGA